MKTVNKSIVNVGETVEYSITLTNQCTSPLTNLSFQDTIPDVLTFVTGSVVINNISFMTANPNVGFALPDIPGGGSVTVTFEARADSVPAVNPTLNSANITYSYTPVEGGIPGVFEVTSNEVAVTIQTLADISVIKTASPNPVTPGELLTFEISIHNAGPSSAESVTLNDTIPSLFLNAEYSVDGGVTFLPWTGSLNIGTLMNQETRLIAIRGTVSTSAMSSFSNTATVVSSTPDPNPDNNTSTIVVHILTARCQAITDIIQSVAMQETALSHILNAEGEKIQKFVSIDDIRSDQLLMLNDSVKSLVGSVARLESVLQAKLQGISHIDC